MITSRFALPVSILLLMALPSTILHSYMEATVSDGLVTEAIGKTLNKTQSLSTKRRDDWVGETFSSSDWIEREYYGPDGNVLLFVARSFDHKRLYHHPEIGILRGVDLGKAESIELAQSPAIPVSVLRSQVRQGAAGYVLLYDGEFVENPMIFQLKTSISLLFGPRKSMTLFFVYDSELSELTSFNTSPAARILEQAIDSFRNQKQLVE